MSGVFVFGIMNNLVCVGSVYVLLIYMWYGFLIVCYNGIGGLSIMDVYGLDGKNILE